MQRSTSVVGRWHRLEVLQVGLRVVVENDSGIEEILRVEERFDAAHQAGGLASPFHLDEGRHVAAGAVLGLERAVVFVDDEFAYLIHEARIAIDLGGVAEVLGEDEVEVAFERMAKDDALAVAVLPQQGLQVQRCGGQRFDRERRRPR